MSVQHTSSPNKCSPAEASPPLRAQLALSKAARSSSTWACTEPHCGGRAKRILSMYVRMHGRKVASNASISQSLQTGCICKTGTSRAPHPAEEAQQAGVLFLILCGICTGSCQRARVDHKPRGLPARLPFHCRCACPADIRHVPVTPRCVAVLA